MISVCCNSWKHPSICEFDDQLASTRILISLRLNFGLEIFLLAFQLEFSPRCIVRSSSTGSTADQCNGGNDHTLTCQRQSPLLSYDKDFPGRSHITSATRTGRAIGSFLIVNDSQVSSFTWIINTINMYDFIERAALGPDVVVPIARVIPQFDLSKLTNGLIIDDDGGILMMFDRYSGALWYRRGRTLCIHYFD